MAKQFRSKVDEIMEQLEREGRVHPLTDEEQIQLSKDLNPNFGRPQATLRFDPEPKTKVYVIVVTDPEHLPQVDELIRSLQKKGADLILTHYP